MKDQLDLSTEQEEKRKERRRETERKRVSPDNHTKLNKNNFSEKIFLLKSSVGKKERTQFALSALGLGGRVGGGVKGGRGRDVMTSQSLLGGW